jgi:hypothetical protein
MPIADGDQLARDLGHSLVPGDPSETSVRHPLERMVQSVVMVLVMLQARCFLAEIPLRIRVPLVSTNANEAITLDFRKQPAVARTQNAGSRFDSHRARPGTLG